MCVKIKQNSLLMLLAGPFRAANMLCSSVAFFLVIMLFCVNLCIKLEQTVYVAVSRLGCCLCENCVCVNCVWCMDCLERGVYESNGFAGQFYSD